MLLFAAHASDHAEDDPIEPRKELGESTNLQIREGKAVKPKKLPIGKGGSAVGTVKKAKAPKKTTAESGKKKAAVTEQLQINHESESHDIQDSDKKRAKKSKGEAQTKIGKNKITKPGALNNKKIKSVASAKKLEKTDRSVVEASTKENGDMYPLGEEPLDLGLIEAIKRRKVWTPIKDTLQPTSRLEECDTTPRAGLGPEDGVNGHSAPSGFENLLGDYGYAHDDNDSLAALEKTRDSDGKASTKRRKIELVNLAVYPSVPVAQSKKPKQPKKKPQTITEKATAPFLSEESAAPSLLQYFGAPATEPNESPQTENHFSNVSKPKTAAQKSRAKGATNSTTSKSKKKAEQPPILLSPKTAMKSTTHQELVFGTSSQLVRDESPSFINDLQQAIEVSESMNEQTAQVLTKAASAGSRPGFYGVPAVTPFKSSRNLWSVAARDSNGSLLNTEVIDLVDTPKVSKSVPVGEPVITVSEKPGVGLDSMEKGPRTVEELSEPRLERDTSRKPPVEQHDSIVEQPIPKSLAEGSLRDRRKSRSPLKKHKIPKDSDIPAPEHAPGQMPNYQGFTTIELSKEVANYGFKAIKKRTEMIALLERCWESQSRIALEALPVSANLDNPLLKSNPENPKQASPKKKGRPRKASAIASANDRPTDDPSSKKPRGRPRKEKQTTSSSEAHPHISKPSLAHDSILPPVHASHPSADRIQTSATSVPVASVSQPAPPSSSVSPNTLLSHITQAITTFPPTHSSTNPTFHEKILLYEPIVIEDLTVWLNTKGLGRVGVDEEISGLLVKEWCEQRSVCCFWREDGWRAKR